MTPRGPAGGDTVVARARSAAGSVARTSIAARLLAGFASFVFDVTEAVACSDPAPFTRGITVTFVGRRRSAHATTWLPLQVPYPADAETNERPSGSRSTKTTPLAAVRMRFTIVAL